VTVGEVGDGNGVCGDGSVRGSVEGGDTGGRAARARGRVRFAGGEMLEDNSGVVGTSLTTQSMPRIPIADGTVRGDTSREDCSMCAEDGHAAVGTVDFVVLEERCTVAELTIRACIAGYYVRRQRRGK